MFYLIYDAFNFWNMGVVEADSEAEALEIAEDRFASVLEHRYEAYQIEVIAK